MTKTKHIFGPGGVLSALGKGIAAASIGRLLESHGYRITLQKFDPYLNVDPGTMSPFQNGEVYVTEGNDIVIVEIGGTVGDIESLPFLEPTRQMRLELGLENVLFVHLTLVPYIGTSGELKTKPTQHSVKELRAIGIQPDILLCRTDRSLTTDIKSKIALFTNVPLEAVITAKDVDNIYEIPLLFAEEGLDSYVLKKLGSPPKRRHLAPWQALVTRMRNPRDEVTIALEGKYAGLQDSYLSLKEALKHGGIAHGLRVNICWIESEDLEKGKREQVLGDKDGILVPGGFGVRGIG